MDATERRKRASSEAADWFARLQAGEMERAEREQFVEWLRESYVHVTEMLRVAQIHGELKQFEHWARITTGPKAADENIVDIACTPAVDSSPTAGNERRSRGEKIERLRSPRLTIFAVAATVLLIAAAALTLPRIRGEVIETQRGERRQVVLSDGSVLQVDPETRLRVKYADERRQVFLDRGRALFRVAKNSHRPFLVQANGTTVRAVGTEFGVDEQTQGIVVTVAEGRVAVSTSEPPLYPLQTERASQDKIRSPDSAPSPSLPHLNRGGPGKGEGSGDSASPSNGQGGAFSRDYQPNSPTLAERSTPQEVQRGTTLFLSADQQVTVSSNGASDPVREVDSHQALAWAEGRLIFQNDELGKAVAEFNRYNHMQIIVLDAGLAAKPVSGVFNAVDPQAFIAFIQTVTAVKIVREGDTRITIDIASR